MEVHWQQISDSSNTIVVVRLVLVMTAGSLLNVVYYGTLDVVFPVFRKISLLAESARQHD